MLNNVVNFIVDNVSAWGYLGIFIMMFLESSFFPFPSEVAMIPAGYLAKEGKMIFAIAWFVGTAGSLFGAIFNYYLCYFFGRELILKYGKFIGINEEKMSKFEDFFNKHGEISTFNSRLIPGIRQYISLPAGLAKMNIFKFCIFTTLGAGIWVGVLLCVGYFLGTNYDHKALTQIIIAIIFVIIIFTLFYIYKNKKHKNKLQ
ncbi:MAG: DedA family protein [Campylobacter sp.]